MRALTELVLATNEKVVAIVGSGGKTTLLWQLARAARKTPDAKVLVATTTKIYEPPAQSGQYDRFLAADELDGAPAVAGVTLAGARVDGGKLAAPPEGVLARAAQTYDHVLLECDGAATLPLKGWAPHEPVVPAFCGLTVGVVPVCAVGLAATAQVVHRLDVFCRIAGISPGDAVTPAALARMICHGEGLFAKARGQKMLVLNQAESEYGFAVAREVAAALLPEFAVRVVAGSAQRDEATDLGREWRS